MFLVGHHDKDSMRVHWKIITKRILRRIKYVFDLKEPITWQYESCENCGHCFKVCWDAQDENWIEVCGSDNGCLCIDCFVEMAKRKGIKPKIEKMKLFNPE